MNKALKRIIITLLILVIAAAAFLAAWVLFIFPNIADPNRDAVAEENLLPELLEADKHVSVNKETGEVYVNNEIVVFVSGTVSAEQARSLLGKYDADLDESMADIGIYKMIFRSSRTYDEMQATLSELKGNASVTDAYLNPVILLDDDTAGSGTAADTRVPVFPNDKWNDATWSVSVPRGENWGVEAINAPGAWAYLSELSEVNIGLIDSFPDTGHNDLTFSSTHCLFVDTSTGLTSTNTYSVPTEKHGTHVSGIMGADWNNETGLSGVMGGKGHLYYSSVYYISNGSYYSTYGTAYSYLLALKDLIDQDVQVINISQNTSRLIGFAASHGNQNAINYLSSQAALTERGLSRIITSRQNSGKPDFVICVAAGNNNNKYYYKDDSEQYGYRTKMTFTEEIKAAFGWTGETGGAEARYNNFLNLMTLEEVKDRVIVVGAVGIDYANSSTTQTRYRYTDFSNIGDRVDVVAPGVDIYSSIPNNGYDSLDGTSMSTPHVTGVAGLIFAANPDLSGPEVKAIILGTTTGRYYYEGGYSGMVNAKDAVVSALKTKTTTVKRVLTPQTTAGLDLCFVVDTTGSMGDDIASAKDNMTSIMEHLAGKTSDYRVALIDYRDFSERTGDSDDYPSRIQLNFTASDDAIISAIRALSLGDGGDEKETVYSALMAAVGLNWRDSAKKVIIIMGDAAPLDPEPNTGYTFEDVLLALHAADINLDYEDSDRRVTDSLDDSLISVYSIGTNPSDSAEDFFEKLSLGTGGIYSDVDDAADVGDAIAESIDQIELIPLITVEANFGAELANTEIAIYREGIIVTDDEGTEHREDEYLFTLRTDGEGKAVIEAVEEDRYRWKSSDVYAGGVLELSSESETAEAEVTESYWFSPVLKLWNQQRDLILLIAAGVLALCILILLVASFGKWVSGRGKKAKEKQLELQRQQRLEWERQQKQKQMQEQQRLQMERQQQMQQQMQQQIQQQQIRQQQMQQQQMQQQQQQQWQKQPQWQQQPQQPQQQASGLAAHSRFCPVCGAQCSPGIKFCGNCGAIVRRNDE